MAKKKSKTQKYKKNQKKKLQKELVSTKVTKSKTTEESAKKTTIKNKQLVEKDKVEYNIALKKQTKKATQSKKDEKTEQKKTLTKKVETKNEIAKKEPKKTSKPKEVKENKFLIKTKELVSKLKEKITTLKNTKPIKDSKNIQFKKNNHDIKKKNIQKTKKTIQKDIPKPKKEAEIKNKNIFIRLLYGVFKNMHIIFNTILIITFLLMLIGLFRINTFSNGTIAYICAIAIFLMLVAISYNKYLSGKIFTIILTTAMGFAIYQMQYTYDFIRNLNTNLYEYKTYYVVTFNTSANRSIYTINNKKVGLLKENCTNIERKLNTKLDQVNYQEYEDINTLFSDFFNQKYRAIIVNENQYKYLKNNIEQNSRDVKILYEFKANAKK